MNRRKLTGVCALALALTTVLSSSAFAVEGAGYTRYPSYPTAITRSEDGTEIRKMYDLGPEDDPVGIPRSDFEQDGYHYTLTDLLKQELPANESREHTETVSVASKNKDMASVLALLPQTKEFITEDGLSGTLSLQLDTVKVDVAGYGSATKNLTATRTYPGLAWNGNVAVAGHNRGVRNDFGKLHTLKNGAVITLTTALGTRNYAVTSVSKVLSTDTSGLTATAHNQITLYTCVEGQPACRWCVKAVEIV